MKLLDLSLQKQEEIEKRFILPEDKSNIYVDEDFRPYDRTEIGRFMCSIRKEYLICGGFHTHGGRN